MAEVKFGEISGMETKMRGLESAVFQELFFCFLIFWGGGGVEINGKEWGKWRELGKMGGGKEGCEKMGGKKRKKGENGIMRKMGGNGGQKGGSGGKWGKGKINGGKKGGDEERRGKLRKTE